MFGTSHCETLWRQRNIFLLISLLHIFLSIVSISVYINCLKKWTNPELVTAELSIDLNMDSISVQLDSSYYKVTPFPLTLQIDHNIQKYATLAYE